MDLQENVKAQENLAYALKVKISNLQKMAETLVWVQENNINDLTELNDLCKTAQANAQAAYEIRPCMETRVGGQSPRKVKAGAGSTGTARASTETQEAQL